MNSVSFINNFANLNYKKSNIVSFPVNNNINFKGNEISKEAADAIKSQQIATQNIQDKNFHEYTAKDINFSYTCQGYRELEGNTRHVNDNRYDWYKEGRKIKVSYNSNGDEGYNGPSTRLIFPIPKGTEGVRNGDNMSILISGHVPVEDIKELIKKMNENNVQFNYRDAHYFSKDQPQFRKDVASLLSQIQQGKNQTTEVNEVNKAEENKPKVKYNLSVNDVNITEAGHIQADGNSREVKDYLREYMNSGKKRTIIHDKFKTPEGEEKDTTVLLVPQDSWDFAAIAVDANIPDDVFEGAIKHVSSNKITSTDDERFKPTMIEYLNK